MLVSSDLKYLYICRDYSGYYILFEGSNMNQQIARKSSINPKEVTKLVRKYNGKNIRVSKNGSMHRFAELDDANKFGIKLESIIMMNKLV